MAKIRILGKTIDAIHVLRQRESPLPKDARTLLMLVDGQRHTGELRALAVANGVSSFEESLEQLERENLVREQPDTDAEIISLDGSNGHVSRANLITLDFAVAPNVFDDMRKGSSGPTRAPAASSLAAPAVAECLAEKTVAASPANADEKRARCERETRRELVERLRPQVEQELRAALLPALRAKLEAQLRSKLVEVLQPHIERQLRAQISAQIKPQIERELRERLQAEASANAESTPDPGTKG